MDKELLDYTARKVDELLAATSSSQVTREAAQGWKDAIAAAQENPELPKCSQILSIFGKPISQDSSAEKLQDQKKEPLSFWKKLLHLFGFKKDR